MNLLFNAVDAMGPNGILTVGTEIGESEEGTRILKIHIQDTGTGIAPENAARLFEPFFTTKKTARAWVWPSASASSRSIAGSFMRKVGSGLGSTFTIHLPVNARVIAGATEQFKQKSAYWNRSKRPPAG